MKVVFKVMSEDSLKRQKQEEKVKVQEEGREVFRINSEVRPMMDSIEAGNGEEGRRKETTRGRRRKERRGRQKEEVMRREKEKQEEEEVKERRSEWRREEPLAKPSLTGGAALVRTPLAAFLLFLALPHIIFSTNSV